MTTNPLDDGMTELRAVLAAIDAERVWQELSRRARTSAAHLRASGEPGPGVDALRADALVAAILQPAETAQTAETAETTEAADTTETAEAAEAAETTGTTNATRQGGQRGPAPVQVHVSVDLATLLGLAEHPGELTGYGPIPAELARELAADGEWARWITDPESGQLLDLSPRKYRPSESLAAFVRAAHPRCGWTGCRQPAARCDLDHIVDFDRGGPTIRANLGPLCRQHHNAKTHGRWQYRRDGDNTAHLRSPLGHTYDIPPPRHPPW